jgi:type II secretory pathway pseudopilin PulG|tara:strand:+ start:540 stop:935 length:396 start_codon:yes stop_codon:yes gene_type:complete
MQQVLIGIILVLGLGSFYLYNQNQVLSANNLALEGAVAEQQAAMEVMKESYERQGKALNNLASKNAQIEQEMNSYLDIFRRHNLNQLAVAKPGMIEKRINDATNQVFESIENDSKELDTLDDPSNDINPNN